MSRLLRTVVTRPDLARPRTPIGLGDVVAAVAQPVARAIDSVMGTEIERCHGCARRRAALNHIIPDIRP